MAVEQLSRIENQVMIRAPRSRVWNALTTPSEFSKWFHATVSVHEFGAGVRVDLVSTYPGHEGTAFFFEIVEKVPEHRFVWRWSPDGIDDPHTTVVFELEEVDGGTLVKVTESGFDRISIARRAKAFEGNTEGWQIQMQNIHDYVEQNR
jgi:uncharacterized protein YndB with AHSA1/START domain